MGGLVNRFPKEVFWEWEDYYKCHWCGESGRDSLHHIIAPTSDVYLKGDFNKSIYNSCPIHNFKCHLYNPDLNKRETISDLLIKTFQALDVMGYEPTERDYKFVKAYKKLYERPDERSK
ncbi:MAG: hypothetical protein ACOC5T_07595 [Elusimicrobiota bacterium]